MGIEISYIIFVYRWKPKRKNKVVQNYIAKWYPYWPEKSQKVKDIQRRDIITKFSAFAVIVCHSPGEGQAVRDVQRRQHPHTQGGEWERDQVIGRRPRHLRGRGSSSSHSPHQDVVLLPVSSLLSLLLLFHSPLPSLLPFRGPFYLIACVVRGKSLWIECISGSDF